MQAQTERWELPSGTWYRDSTTETWRLAATADGTAVNETLPTRDIGRMVLANRDAASGQWFPADFDYSPQTGARLERTIGSLDSSWVPPFGTPALSGMTAPSSRGLRQTPAPLALFRSSTRHDPSGTADRILPSLPVGQYRFLVHEFDAALPILMAIEPECGKLLVLLPESKIWVPLQRPTGGLPAHGLRNSRGWRMEVIEDEDGRATLYLPTAFGLAALTPTLIGLSYTVDYFGAGPALGGPVAWAGEVWLPVLGSGGVVELVGKPPGAAQPIVLPTGACPPGNGFEAPVFDPFQIIWPSEEGQLIIRRDEAGGNQIDWIAWPDGRVPAFSLGCPYLSRSGSFWQPCWAGPNRLEYVEMGKPDPQKAAIDAPRIGTGRISYRQDQRIEGDPWSEPVHAADGASSAVVVPLLESEFERAVVGLRIAAPQGLPALLQSDRSHRAILQLQSENHAHIPFGTLTVTKPWLASLFIYDSHLWVHHPDLSRALGWKLEMLAISRKRRAAQGVRDARLAALQTSGRAARSEQLR